MILRVSRISSSFIYVIKGPCTEICTSHGFVNHSRHMNFGIKASKKNFHLTSYRSFDVSSVSLLPKKVFINPFEGELQKKLEKTSPQIVFIDENENPTVMPFKEAQSICRAAGMKLVRVNDPTTTSQYKNLVYKKVSMDEFREILAKKEKEKEESKKKRAFRDRKTLVLSHSIDENDFNVKMNHMHKWLSKSHQVTVLINWKDKDVAHLIEKVKTSVEGHGTLIQESENQVFKKLKLNPLVNLREALELQEKS